MLAMPPHSFPNRFATYAPANESNETSYDRLEISCSLFLFTSVRPSRSDISWCSLNVLRSAFSSVILILLAAAVLVAQTSGGASPAPTVSIPGQQNPFLGSAPEGKATSEVLQIDFKEAIDRGLRTNLGLLLAADQTEQAQG